MINYHSILLGLIALSASACGNSKTSHTQAAGSSFECVRVSNGEELLFQSQNGACPEGYEARTEPTQATQLKTEIKNEKFQTGGGCPPCGMG